MSHLSQIKTKIHDSKVLEKTLNDLGFIYELKNQNQNNFIVKNKQSEEFELVWNGQEYLILTDIEMWKNNLSIECLVDQITQQYSYNSILEESMKYGFNSVNKEFTKDGSIRLTVQRWN